MGQVIQLNSKRKQPETAEVMLTVDGETTEVDNYVLFGINPNEEYLVYQGCYVTLINSIVAQLEALGSLKLPEDEKALMKKDLEDVKRALKTTTLSLEEW